MSRHAPPQESGDGEKSSAKIPKPETETAPAEERWVLPISQTISQRSQKLTAKPHRLEVEFESGRIPYAFDDIVGRRSFNEEKKAEATAEPERPKDKRRDERGKRSEGRPLLARSKGKEESGGMRSSEGKLAKRKTSKSEGEPRVFKKPKSIFDPK